MKGKWVLSVLMMGWVAASDTSFAARPLTIDDADTLDVRQFKIEGGVAHSRDSDCNHWDFPVCFGYGLVDDVEVGIGLGSQFEERNEVLDDGRTDDCSESGIGDLVVAAKWRFIKECPLGARHAIVPSVKFPTADEDKGLGSGETDYDLTWIASRGFGENAGAHVNAGYSWIGKPDDEDADDVAHYGIALDYQLTAVVQWVAEVFAEKELNDNEDTAVQYNTGFRWNPADNLTLDIAGGSKLRGEAPDFTATVGLTWTFGFVNSQGN